MWLKTRANLRLRIYMPGNSVNASSHPLTLYGSGKQISRSLVTEPIALTLDSVPTELLRPESSGERNSLRTNRLRSTKGGTQIKLKKRPLERHFLVCFVRSLTPLARMVL